MKPSHSVSQVVVSQSYIHELKEYIRLRNTSDTVNFGVLTLLTKEFGAKLSFPLHE